MQHCAKVCKGMPRKGVPIVQNGSRVPHKTTKLLSQYLAFVTASGAANSRSTGHAQVLHDAALYRPSSRDADELLGCSPCMSVLAAQSLSWDAKRCTKMH